MADRMGDGTARGTPVDGICVGGVAPFHYGTQSSGDVFTPFIKKDEPYPAENPRTLTFRTRQPNQRTIAVSVYGGNHLERASLNEKQGELFAVLPPGLEIGTRIYFRVWLDSDGVFDLSAMIEDGRGPQALLLQGEKDQKAVQAIQRIDELLNNPTISCDRRSEVEAARDHAFARLQRKDFGLALEVAEGYLGVLAEAEQTGASFGVEGSRTEKHANVPQRKT